MISLKNKIQLNSTWLIFFITSALFILTAFLLIKNSSSINSDYFGKNNGNFNSGLAKSDQYDTITVVAVGDLMCHSQQTAGARTKTGYDFSQIFTAITPYIETGDIAFGNLETVTAGEELQYTGYPRFNTPVEYLDAIKGSGFDVLTNVNNHSLDRNFAGIEKTIDALDQRGLYHTGTYKTSEERDKILIVQAKDIKMAVLGYTFSTNGIPLPAGKEFCVNLIDTSLMKQDVAKAKSLGVDKIAVFIHWGNEYERFPNSFQKGIADFLLEQGVDIIFGSHPHVIQPMELRTVGDKTKLIIYSMGNFISGQRKKYTDCGLVVRVQLIKNKKNNETVIGKIDFIPTYVSVQGGFKILPVKNALDAIDYRLSDSPFYSPLDASRLKEVWQETNFHLTDSAKGIFPYTGK